MSDTDNAAFPGFGQLVPGFDFLQNLAKQATGAANSAPQMPNLGSWVAPTLNVEELDKRIQELKAVQFWLDQNATALKATIQALEVQKMTLATLKGMNFSMSELANSFKLKTPDKPAATDKHTFAGLEVPPSAFQAAQAAEAAKKAGQEPDEEDDEQEDSEDEGDDDNDTEEADEPNEKPTAARAGGKSAKSGNGAAASPAAGVVDPMQWWGALTQQFQNIATEAMQDVAKKTSLNTGKTMADDAVKAASDMAKGVAKTMADTASKTAAGGVRAMSTALRSNQAWPTPGAPKAARPAAPKAKAKTASAVRAPAKKSKAKTGAKTGTKAVVRKNTR